MKSDTIIREINAEGKSRAFVNDTPINLSVLKELQQFWLMFIRTTSNTTLQHFKQLNVLDIAKNLNDSAKNFQVLSWKIKLLNQSLFPV